MSALQFVALGGAGEFGLNCTAYGVEDRWLVVDCGALFGDTRETERLVPDVGFLAARREALVGLVITHAHEDHLGALVDVWPRLGCPIYTTPFCAAVLRRKSGMEGPGRRPEVAALQAALVEVPLGSRRTLGPFDVEWVALTHSIPEPTALIVRTAAGTVVHTGDWRLDPAPMVGAPVDPAPLLRAGDEGVLALVGDSTNADRAVPAPSEDEVARALLEVVANRPGRVAVTCFASNLGRIEAAARAARAVGREVAPVGRAFGRMIAAARDVGLAGGLGPLVSESDAGYLPPSRVLLLAGGSQGEPKGALRRLADDTHPRVLLDPGDLVVFSSRVIPGNEPEVADLIDRLRRRGITVLTADDAPIHASGHPSAPELQRMYGWARPRLVVAVHGEPHQQAAQAEVARQAGVPRQLVPRDGELYALDGDGARLAGQVPTGRVPVASDR